MNVSRRHAACALMLIALVTAGCSTLEQRQARRLSADMYDTHLRKISSAAEIDQLVENGRRLSALRYKIEADYRRRKQRSGSGRPASCEDTSRGATAEDADSITLDRVRGSRNRPLLRDQPVAWIAPVGRGTTTTVCTRRACWCNR